MAVAPKKRWFHPNINGATAEKLLTEKGLHGSFLVRFSSGEKNKPNPNFTLSVKRREEVTHIKIRRYRDGFYDLFGGEPFASLSDLIQFYMKNEDKLIEKSGEVIELRFPLNCEDLTFERWFHGKIYGPASAEMLMPHRVGTYIVRESQKDPETFCVSVKTDDTVTHIKIGQTSEGFNLGDRRNFNTINELLEYYKANPIIDATQNVVQLNKPLNVTSFHVEHIFERIAELQKVNKVKDGNQFDLNGFGEEFNSIQQQEFTHSFSRDEGMRAVNQTKNCFKNIIPFDYTRVKLRSPTTTSPEADYINANWAWIEDEITMRSRGSSIENESISGLDVVVSDVIVKSVTKEYDRLHKLYSGNKQYIATQGCLKSTTADFWQMIWQENVQIIALLQKTFTYTSKMFCWKFSKYWPDLGDTVTHGNFNITTKNIKSCTDYISTELCVRNIDSGSGEEKIVYHYQFNAWPEHGVPHCTDRLLNFLYDVDKQYRWLTRVSSGLFSSLSNISLNSHEELNVPIDAYEEPTNKTAQHPNTQFRAENLPPIVVQCHSGIGRTGTMIVIDMIIDRIKRKGFDCEIDIHHTVQCVRNQRSGMIQTEAQYSFIYEAIAQHINTMRIRLEAEMKSPKRYTNIILGGDYVRKYAFEPPSCLPTTKSSRSNSLTSKKLAFRAELEPVPENSLSHNIPMSKPTPLEAQVKQEVCNFTREKRKDMD